jgi:hypothetical protein
LAEPQLLRPQVFLSGLRATSPWTPTSSPWRPCYESSDGGAGAPTSAKQAAALLRILSLRSNERHFRHPSPVLVAAAASQQRLIPLLKNSSWLVALSSLQVSLHNLNRCSCIRRCHRSILSHSVALPAHHGTPHWFPTYDGLDGSADAAAGDFRVQSCYGCQCGCSCKSLLPSRGAVARHGGRLLRPA